MKQIRRLSFCFLFLNSCFAFADLASEKIWTQKGSSIYARLAECEDSEENCFIQIKMGASGNLQWRNGRFKRSSFLTRTGAYKGLDYSTWTRFAQKLQDDDFLLKAFTLEKNGEISKDDFVLAGITGETAFSFSPNTPEKIQKAIIKMAEEFGYFATFEDIRSLDLTSLVNEANPLQPVLGLLGALALWNLVNL